MTLKQLAMLIGALAAIAATLGRFVVIVGAIYAYATLENASPVEHCALLFLTAIMLNTTGGKSS